MDTDERYVVRQIVNRALDKGYLLSVFDGKNSPCCTAMMRTR